jgi:hypothetical protein
VRRLRMRLLFVVAILVSAGLGVFTGVGGAAQMADARVRQCGSLGPVDAVFDIPQARNIWDRLPALGKSPELEIDVPASVVMYSGRVGVPVLGTTGSDTAEYDNIVCILLENGERYVYADVSRAGFSVP